MINLIEDIFSYDFLINALWACLLSGVTCGIIGSYIVARRMVFLSGGITHASFGGLGIALYAGFDPLLGALGFAATSAVGIEYASRRGSIREDSAIGIIWSVGMALGALFMSLRPGYATDLTSYLFGNILLVTHSDVLWLAMLTIFIVLGSLLSLRYVMFITFDEDFARSQGVATTLTAYIMSILIAVTIVLSIKVMGVGKRPAPCGDRKAFNPDGKRVAVCKVGAYGQKPRKNIQRCRGGNRLRRRAV